MPTRFLWRVTAAVVAVALLGPVFGSATTATPDHLLLMVFDQMRPDYIDRFNLPHFKRLRATARHYSEAYVGHLSSQTVVAHAVISTGLPPGALPWQDDAMIDAAGALGPSGTPYKTGDLTRAQYWKLLEGIPRTQFLGVRIRDAFGGGVFAVGGKNYAATLIGGPHADGIVTLEKAAGRCTPDGINVPAYILEPPRFSLDCTDSYGTGYSTIYAWDGNHYAPGRDTDRQGGDVWTADAALAVMRRERWSALFVTFGAIDKVGHMLGEQDGEGLVSVASEYRLGSILETADAQLGRLLDALDDLDLSRRTLVVVTADHGGQRNAFYLGNGRSQSCCPFQNSSTSVDPPYWLEHLNQVGRLKAAYVDTSITLWLADRSPENERAVTRGLTDVSGVTQIFARREGPAGVWYEQVLSRLDSQTARFQSWARRHSANLVATMAGPSSPDLVALLADGFGFGRIGGHGGAQEAVQRIPMIIRVPGEAPSLQRLPLRLMDVASEVTRILGLAPAPRTAVLPR